MKPEYDPAQHHLLKSWHFRVLEAQKGQLPLFPFFGVTLAVLYCCSLGDQRKGVCGEWEAHPEEN